jgi:hypothetical protein
MPLAQATALEFCRLPVKGIVLALVFISFGEGE